MNGWLRYLLNMFVLFFVFCFLYLGGISIFFALPVAIRNMLTKSDKF